MSLYLNDLKTNGFVIIRNLYDQLRLSELLADIKAGVIDSSSSENIPRLNRGSDIIYNPFLIKKTYFDLFREKTVESILKSCLNDNYYQNLGDAPNYILRSMICRSSKDMLPWHIDSFIPFTSEYASTVQVIIPLESFTSTSGATLLYKASHQFGEYSPQEHESDAEIVELHAEPGDVVIWDARIWHAAKANQSDGTRWAIISTFTRWWIKQNYRYVDEIVRTNQLEMYTNEDLAILGGASQTPLNHSENIDLKGGFERIESLRSSNNVR